MPMRTVFSHTNRHARPGDQRRQGKDDNQKNVDERVVGTHGRKLPPRH